MQDYKYYGSERQGNPIACLILIVFGMAMGIIFLASVKSCNSRPPAPGQMDCRECHNRKAAMVNYFRKNGSKSPEQMAFAVLRTSNPRLLAAIAKVESRGNPHTRNTGYRKRHDGAFQVASRHWGKVPYDAAGQALQAERVITELTTDYGIKKALDIYGGDSTDHYQKTVLAELVNVP